ncbi:hypothetical protein ACWJKU_17150 [Methylocaldum sp. MU1018]
MDDVIPAAPGVAYTEVHGLRMFRCTALGATITVKSCAENYRAAKSALRVAYRPHLQHCQGCPIGACHAGEKPRTRPIARQHGKVCPRCKRKSARYVPSAALCVSCWNRSKEIERGRNRHGNPPIELLQRAPVPHSIMFTHNGEPVRFERLAVDSLEPLLAAVFMARSPETLRFVFGRPDLEPVDNEPAPDWQRSSTVRERRALDREKQLAREASCAV